MRERLQVTTAVAGLTIAAIIVLTAIAAAARLPMSPSAAARSFVVAPGAGIREITETLGAAGAIKSKLLFIVYAGLTGHADALKPGAYEIPGGSSIADIVRRMVNGPREEITVTVHEGATIAQIDALMSGAGVFAEGSLRSYRALHAKLEGYLFPDTYRFFPGTAVEDVVEKMKASFEAKARPVLNADTAHAERNLILASMVEKEVPTQADRRIVAGLLLKRFSAGMPLQVDASICYLKEWKTNAPCYPLRRNDFSIESPYNTYTKQGFPPAPISNPGIAAIQAAMTPRSSPYWYYLSDPKTKKTVFSVTLDEHTQNRVKYLGL
ncbi:MAG: endolytic transglycosylase MltG [Candidatus Liptonbacteria bacterium]|nr:endolytic transglycosylase MltG [Candidatus Liptonbacteria bacterium]